jgi:hypothetical protein
LERISELVLRDVQQGSYLKKNRKYEGTDFEFVKRNIENVSRLIKMQGNAAKMSPAMRDGTDPESEAHYMYDEQNRGMEHTENENETATEDMSMSVQRQAEPNYRSGNKAVNSRGQFLLTSPKGGEKAPRLTRQSESAK